MSSFPNEFDNNSPTDRMSDDGSSSESDSSIDSCPICLVALLKQEIGVPNICEHVFCVPCIKEWSQNINNCPIDRKPFTSIIVKNNFENAIVLREIPVEGRAAPIEVVEDLTFCQICSNSDREETMLLCDGCDLGYHMECLTPQLAEVPLDAWFCHNCVTDEPSTSRTAATTASFQSNILHANLRARTSRILRTRQSERIQAVILARNNPHSLLVPQSSRSAARNRNFGIAGHTTRRKRRSKRTKGMKRSSKRQSQFVAKKSASQLSKQMATITSESACPKTNLQVQRSRAGIPVLQLFGSRYDLDYIFPDDNENEEIRSDAVNRDGMLIMSSSVGVSRGGNLKSRLKSSLFANSNPCYDLLSSIMESQERLHSSRSRYANHTSTSSDKVNPVPPTEVPSSRSFINFKNYKEHTKMTPGDNNESTHHSGVEQNGHWRGDGNQKSENSTVTSGSTLAASTSTSQSPRNFTGNRLSNNDIDRASSSSYTSVNLAKCTASVKSKVVDSDDENDSCPNLAIYSAESMLLADQTESVGDGKKDGLDDPLAPKDWNTDNEEDLIQLGDDDEPIDEPPTAETSAVSAIASESVADSESAPGVASSSCVPVCVQQQKNTAKRGILELYDESDFEEWTTDKTTGKEDTAYTVDTEMLSDIEDIRSFTPCLDEIFLNESKKQSSPNENTPPSVDGSKNQATSVSVIEDIQMELISDEDNVSLKDGTQPEANNIKEGGIVESAKDATLSKSDHEKAKSDRKKTLFKKVSNAVLDRSYRAKDKLSKGAKPSVVNDKENSDRKKSEREHKDRKHTKRKDLKRYDVRNVITEKNSRAHDRIDDETFQKSGRKSRSRSPFSSDSDYSRERSLPKHSSSARYSYSRRSGPARNSHSRERKKRSRSRSRSLSPVNSSPSVRGGELVLSSSDYASSSNERGRSNRSRGYDDKNSRRRRSSERDGRSRRHKRRSRSRSRSRRYTTKDTTRTPSPRDGGGRGGSGGRSGQNCSWTPPLDSLQQRDTITGEEHLTVVFKNKSRTKRKTKRSHHETSVKDTSFAHKEKRKKRKTTETSVTADTLSKEVFASGENILVSVSFNSAQDTAPSQTRNKNTPAKVAAARPPAPIVVNSGEKKVRKRRTLNDLANERVRKRSVGKPIAIIDLDRSPFKELTPSPKMIIELSDSDDHETVEKNSDVSSTHKSVDSSSKRVDDEQTKRDRLAPTANSIVLAHVVSSHMNIGPKTPPNPQPKFSMSVKSNTFKLLTVNPLLDANECESVEPSETDMVTEDLPIIDHNKKKVGPNTPPEPAPNTPDAYDPFEPTKSVSASPDINSGCDSIKNTEETESSSPIDHTKNKDDSLNDATGRFKSLLKIVDKDTNLFNLKANNNKQASEVEKEVDKEKECIFPAINKPEKEDVANKLIAPSTHQNEQSSIKVISNVLIHPATTAAELIVTKPVLASQRFFNVSKSMTDPTTATSTITTASTTKTQKRSSISNDEEDNSPYSPGSNDYESLFDPPPQSVQPAEVVSTAVPVSAQPKLYQSSQTATNENKTSKEVFDNLFGQSPQQNVSRNAAKKAAATAASVAATAHLNSRSRNNKTAKSSNKFFQRTTPKSISSEVRLDDHQFKLLDDLPNSAVELQVKDKFLKKLNRQERVVEEVKLVLKPHYNKKLITKEDYKEILRRSVPKICHNRTGEINPQKIQALIEAYVKKFRQRRKHQESKSATK